jgi:O-antigen/teichoic acid export membrane protein
MNTWFARLSQYLAAKRNFIRYSLAAIGIPAVGGVTWLYFEYYADRSVLLWLYMIGVAVVAAYLWGIVMWKLFMSERSARSSESTSGDR